MHLHLTQHYSGWSRCLATASLSKEASRKEAGRRSDSFGAASSRRFLIQILPAAVVAPLFFRGEIEFGVINQSSSAFNHILTDVSLVVYQVRSRCRRLTSARACIAFRMQPSNRHWQTGLWGATQHENPKLGFIL